MSDSGNGQEVGFDVIISAPGAQQALDATASSLRDVGTAAVATAEEVDGLTVSQRALMQAGVSLDQVLAAVNGSSQKAAQVATAQATATNRITDSTRALTLSQIEAIAADTAFNGKFIESRAVLAAHQSALDSVTKSERQLALAQAEAISINDTLNGKYVESRAMVLAHMQALELDAAAAGTDAEANVAAGAAAGVHGLQLGRVNMEVGTATGRILGLNSGLTRFVAMLGGATAGYLPMIALLGVVVAVGEAYKALTAGAKEAAKAADEFAKSDQGRYAESSGVGVARSALGFSSGTDIAALSKQAEDASKAMQGFDKQLADMPRTFDGLDSLNVELRTGQLDATGFQAALRAVANTPNLGEFYAYNIEQLGKVGSLYIANKEALERLNATVEQARAIEQYYTTTLFASSAGEGQLLEQIAQRQSVLAAYQSGGKVAGKDAENSVAALNAARAMYEQYAASGKDATITTLAFQDALKAHNPIAEQFLAEQTKLVKVNTDIARTQQQAASGVSDTNRLTSFTDAIGRLQQEADAFGKDASIDNRIQGMDDQLDHFVQTLSEQVATGKLSKASFEQQAAAVEVLRGNLYEAGDALKQAFNDQVTKQIHDQYLASEQLKNAVVDSTGAYHELTAAKAAQNEIDEHAKQLGHDLSDDAQAEIRAKHLNDAIVQGAQWVQSLHDQADAAARETDAMGQGADAQQKYAIQKAYDLTVSKALTLATDELTGSATAQAERIRAAALAHLELTEAQKTGLKVSEDFEKESRKISDALDKDLLGAINHIATSGFTSWHSTFAGFSTEAVRGIEQIHSSILKLSDDWAKAFEAGDNATADAIDGKLKNLESLSAALGKVASGLQGASVGYGIGESSGSTAVGLVGGAAGGAASGFATAGMWGAVIGGLTGAVGGLFGAADAQHKAAEAIQNAANQLKPQIAGYLDPNSVAQQLAQNDAQFTALLTALNKIVTDSGGYGDVGGTSGYHDTVSSLYAKRDSNNDKVASDFMAGLTEQFNALKGPAGELANQLAALDKSYQDNLDSINALVQANAISGAEGLVDEAKASALHDAQVEAAKKAAAETALESKEDLQVRLQAAQGTAYSVTQLQREIEERRELATATADNLELTKQVIKAEDDKAAADRAQLVADTQANLKVTGLRAAGHTADADALQLTLDQEQRRRDLEQQGLLDLTTVTGQATEAQLEYAESMEKAALASNQAYDAIEKQVSAIKEEAGVFGYSTKEVIDREAQAYHFDGLTRDQIAAQYTVYDGTDLTPDQINKNKEVVGYLSDVDSYTKSIASTANAAATSKVTSQVQSDITGLTEGTGSRVADYLSTEVNYARQSRDYLQSIDEALSASGGAVYRGNINALVPIGQTPQSISQTSQTITGDTSFVVNIATLNVAAGANVNASIPALTKAISQELGRQFRRDMLGLSPSARG